MRPHSIVTHPDPMTDEETAAREREEKAGVGWKLQRVRTQDERGTVPVIFRGVHTVSDVQGEYALGTEC